MDTPKLSIKKYSLSEENNRLLQELIINYAWHMKKNGKADSTIKTVSDRLRLLARHGNLENPESIKEALLKLKWKNSTKHTAVIDYTGFLKYIGKVWTKPKYKPEERLPFIPTEEELNLLIASAGKTYQALLQLLKETGIRIGEAVLLKWIDYDSERKVISVTPEKGSNPRILPISEQLRKMLGMLPKENEYIFPKKKHSYRVTFEALRKRTAQRMNNPRLMKIHFHTFRHFKGTMEYHRQRT